MKKIILLLIFIICFNFTAELKAQNPEWIIYSHDSIPGSEKSNTFYLVKIDSNNNKWVSGNFLPLAVYNNYYWTPFHRSVNTFLNKYIPDIEFDFQGYTWFATFNNGLVKTAPNDSVRYDSTNSGLGTRSVWYLEKYRGNLWISTNKGLVEYDGTNWITYNSSNSDYPCNYAGRLLADKSGNLWIDCNGLVKYDGTNWTVYDTSNSPFFSNRVSLSAVDLDSNIWITLLDGYDTHCEVAKFDGVNWTIYDSTNSGLSSKPWAAEASKVCIDSSGNKWITSADGFYKFDDTTWTRFTPENSGLPSIVSYDCACDRYGNVWIATQGGLAVYREGGVILTGIEHGKDFSPMTIFYPNPSEKSGKIQFELVNPEKVEVVLFTSDGKPVKTILNEYTSSGDHTVIFNTSDLPQGTYFYKFKAGNRVETKKFVVVR